VGWFARERKNKSHSWCATRNAPNIFIKGQNCIAQTRVGKKLKKKDFYKKRHGAKK